MRYFIAAALSLAIAVDMAPVQAAPKAADRPIGQPLPGQSVVAHMGLENVIGKDAATMIRMFGEPRLDVIEVYGRKLQFAGKACILDLYLYPDGRGGIEIVTHVDARRSDGAEVDRAACINALSS